jgi:hypothetical protein
MRETSEQARRRFPPPWSVEETAPCFIVRDANGQALAFVCCEDEPGRRVVASAPTAPWCRCTANSRHCRTPEAAFASAR